MTMIANASINATATGTAYFYLLGKPDRSTKDVSQNNQQLALDSSLVLPNYKRRSSC
jgi:hypothetical protein